MSTNAATGIKFVRAGNRRFRKHVSKIEHPLLVTLVFPLVCLPVPSRMAFIGPRCQGLSLAVSSDTMVTSAPESTAKVTVRK